MKVGLRYVVTKASDDGTFNVGDHIWPEQDGSISCREAGGWVDEADVPEAIKGVETTIDREWANTKLAGLSKEYNDLVALLEAR